MACRVCFLGDSTLDNCVWVAPGEAVPDQLRMALGPQALVVNWAADAFTTTDLLRGAFPRVSGRRRLQVGDPFPTGESLFAPLELLEALPASQRPTHIVLSVGGNDVREVLGARDVSGTVRQLVANSAEIIARIGRICPRLILVVLYRPCAATEIDSKHYGVYAAMAGLPGPGTPMQKLELLLQQSYRAQFAALLQACPGAAVIDLANSYDPYDKNLYVCQIEPSAAGGAITAGLLAHAIQQHDFAGPSMIYAHARGSQTISATRTNPAAWSVAPA
eukprot:TRINITY_DN1762_c0_g1_i2.p1 TRINITY_DN1762_c0_g1~~TRINITY_DN1762_c0_g1_i2.p1  ORF type:complete len:310 (-),score=43.90 TRINITY_DN1762_c0_g1_i2:55-882(-)